MATAQGELSKVKTKLASLELRVKRYYFIVAPQNGKLAKVKTQGFGETVSEGTALATIVPSSYELAVEKIPIDINPIDVPLIHEGSKVMFQFDGWQLLSLEACQILVTERSKGR